MANKRIRTLQGKSIDMEALRLHNEDTRAVGNMNEKFTEANRPKNNTVATNTHRPNNAPRKVHEKRVQDTPVMDSKKAALELAYKYVENTEESVVSAEVITVISKEPEVNVEIVQKPTPVKELPKATPPPVAKPNEEVSEALLEEVISRTNTGGLAGAIAKAQEVKQDQLKTSSEKTGVKKI